MPVTEEQFEAVVNRLEAIAADINKLTHGNGRTGVHALLDDIYGPPDRSRMGLIARVVLLESQAATAAAQRKENYWLQRGIAIGVGLVLLDHTFNLNLGALVGAWFGGAS